MNLAMFWITDSSASFSFEPEPEYHFRPLIKTLAVQLFSSVESSYSMLTVIFQSFK